MAQKFPTILVEGTRAFVGPLVFCEVTVPDDLFKLVPLVRLGVLPLANAAVRRRIVRFRPTRIPAAAVMITAHNREQGGPEA